MKKVLFVIMLGFIGSASIAQSNETELFMSLFKVEKKAALMNYLKLDDAEGVLFWPIYEEFSAKRTEIAKKRIGLIGQYAESYSTMTAAQADVLANESFAIRAEQEKLQKSYYGKFKKAVGAMRASQFVQFERYVNTAIDAELYDEMPFIGE